MKTQSDLSHAAFPLSDAAGERYLVTTYNNLDELLDEVETAWAPSAELAMLMAEAAARQYPVVIVFRERKDSMGVVQSTVLREFGRP